MSQVIFCSQCSWQNRVGARFCQKCGASLAGGTVFTIDLQPGEVMHGKHDYTIVRRLGKGGMGTVYLANQPLANTYRPVVVKEMLEYYDLNDPQSELKARQRFEQEAATLVTLNSAGIPQIFDYFSDSGRNYIVMQFIQGRDLEASLTHEDDQGQLITGRPYPPEQVQRWGSQMAKILEYLATQNVVHMDIKPANLIVNDSGDLWLVDFGTAKARWGAVAGGTLGLRKSSIYGTVGYAPREQYGGRVEPRSDVYALAATLYHLVTDDDPRAHPFQFAKLNQLPGCLAEPLSKALNDDLNQRPSAAEFRRLLEDKRSGNREKYPPYWLFGGLAGVVLVLLLLGGWFAFSDRTPAGQAETAAAMGTATAMANEAGLATATAAANATLVAANQATATAAANAASAAANQATVTSAAGQIATANAQLTDIAQNVTAEAVWAATAEASTATAAARDLAAANVKLTLIAQTATFQAERAATSEARTATASAMQVAAGQSNLTATAEAKMATAEAKGTATARARGTATAAARATATATATPAGPTIVFGPRDSSLVDRNNRFEAGYASVKLRDFTVEATISNPQLSGEGGWGYGFIFRQSSNKFYMLKIYSNFFWKVTLYAGDKETQIHLAQFFGMNTNLGGANRIKLLAEGKHGQLYINDEYVSDLDLSANLNVGDIALTSELIYPGGDIDGDVTYYQDFTVWDEPIQ